VSRNISALPFLMGLAQIPKILISIVLSFQSASLIIIFLIDCPNLHILQTPGAKSNAQNGLRGIYHIRSAAIRAAPRAPVI
jgi:hypothetical protein